MESGQLDFHLVADDKFIDQRAAKRVGIVGQRKFFPLFSLFI